MANLHPRILFIHNPNAQSVVEVPSPDPAFYSTVVIHGEGEHAEGSIELPGGQNDITFCESECALPCVQQQISITFPAVAFGDGCDGCYKEYAVRIRRLRDALLRLDDSFELLNDLIFNFDLTGNQTAVQMAQEFERQLIANEESNGGHALWQSTFVRSGSTVTITFPCEQFFQIDYNGQGFPTNEQPTIAVVNPGQRSSLTPDNMRRIFPLYAYGNQLAMENLGASFFAKCESVCKISLKGCWNWACGTNGEYNNSGTLNPLPNTPIAVDIFVNASAAGYSAFLNQLRTYYNSCNVSASLFNRPLANNQVLRTDSKSTGAGTSVSLATNQFTSVIPAGYNGPVRITVTSTVSKPSPAINASIVVPASVASDPAAVVAAFTAAGYSFLAYTSPNYVITTGKNDDTVSMSYSIS